MTFSWRIGICNVIVLLLGACALAVGEQQGQPSTVDACSPQAISALRPADQANQQTICEATEHLKKAKEALDGAIRDAQTAQRLNNDAAKEAGDASTNAAAASTGAAEAAKETAASQQKVAKAIDKAEVLLPKSAVPGNAVPPLLGDHVPCLMDKDELYALRGIGIDQDPAKTAALETAKELSKSPGSDLSAYSTFTQNLTSIGLANNSPEQVRSKTLAIAQVAGLPDASAEQVSNAAAVAAATTTYNRPTDLGCSMSIMPWKEASKVFGRAVANAFLAVQIVVRNMDPDHEYLLHDAELAVDAYSSAIQRFQAGHEKEVVRGVSVWGQSYGRQAIAAHIVEGVGILMGAVVGMPGIPANFVNATGAYQAGLVPTFNKLFPDLNTSNLNNLNDLAFSAQSNSRIVVPKGGAVPFVLFVPVQPLEEACWLQPGYNFFKDDSFTTACTAICADPKSESCDPQPFAQSKSGKWKGNWKEIAFKDWTPIQLEALQKHAYAAIAGQHFQAVATAATLKTITCTSPDKSGAYYQALIGGDLTCTLTGSDFDTMSKLRMRPPGDTQAADAIDGTVTVSGDTSSATAKIAAADVKKISQPTYNLFAVDKSGNESNLNSTLSFVLSPTVTASPSQTLDLTAKPFTATLKGTNLQQVVKVTLKSTTTSDEIKPTVIHPDQTGTSITLSVPAGSNPKAETYNVLFVLDDAASSPYDPKQTVKVK